MTLINGDRIVTAQLYDDEHEEFVEKKMSIIDYVNAYTDEGVTTADNVIDKIRAEIGRCKTQHEMQIAERDTKSKLLISDIFCDVIEIIDKYSGVKE